MITLNTPVANAYPPQTINGFLEKTLDFDVSAGMVIVAFSLVGPGGQQVGWQACTPIPVATFEAFVAATTRGKMITTIIQYLGLSNGTYTTS